MKRARSDSARNTQLTVAATSACPLAPMPAPCGQLLLRHRPGVARSAPRAIPA